MPRNGAGVFNLAQPAFQSQTPISSSAVNSDLSDIADGLTNSLPRDGQGAMTAVLPLASTGFTYAADPNTGMSRSASDEQVITCGGTVIARFSTTGVDFTGAVTQNGIVPLPPGFVGFTAGATAPAGWLLRNGQAVSRTTYADLFTAIGTAFGSGDGATTFNVPNTLGRVDAGLDGGSGRLYGAVLAQAVGGPTQNLTMSNLPPITPAGSVSISDPGHSHQYSTNTSTTAGPGGGGVLMQGPGLFQTGVSGTGISAGFTGTPTGGNSAAFAIAQATMAMTPIIKF
ncbi:phage tail protein [Tardiphaga sp. 841_E9_N1_2]|uniref:phage tail protein n=1 Tax=Tardiphaga sp. 841_E9_N1_2 TaxID=3240762 RepID=UPI003F233978